jgi:hypothetical protein
VLGIGSGIGKPLAEASRGFKIDLKGYYERINSAVGGGTGDCGNILYP